MPTLELSSLESRLWEAACVVRGPLDAPKFKDYILPLKVFNLIKAIHRLVVDKEQDQPYLISSGERARAIAEAFEKRQITSQQALAELEALVGEYHDAVSKRQESDLSSEGFGVYWPLQ